MLHNYLELVYKYHINFDPSLIQAFSLIYPLFQQNQELLTKKYTLINHPLEIFTNSSVQFVKEDDLNTEHYYFIAFKNDEEKFQKTILDFENEYNHYIIGIDDLSIEKLVINYLHRYNLYLSAAESCTGGLLISRLIGISGASNVIESSYITYSNMSKQKILGVNETSIHKYGVVSAEVAEEMAEGVKKISGADIGIGITGFAGGEDDNPDDGLCYFAIVLNDYVHLEKTIIKGSRNEVRQSQTTYVLWRLYLLLKAY